MNNDATVQEFINKFYNSQDKEIIDEYDYMRYKAFENSEIYSQLCQRIQSISVQTWKQSAFKVAVCNCLVRMCDILEEYTLENRNKKQQLIDFLSEQTYETCNIFSDSFQNEKMRWFTLHLSIDMLISMTNSQLAIPSVAMIYDLICQWNKEDDNLFVKLYGPAVEKNIIDYTYECLKIKYGNKGASITQLLQKCEERNSNKGYVIDFCNKINAKSDLSNSNHDYSNHSVLKSNANEVATQEDKNLQTESALQVVDNERERIYSGDKHSNVISLWEKICRVFAGIFIIIVVAAIAFGTGIFYERRSLSEKNATIEELSAENELLNSNVKELEGENSELQQEYDQLSQDYTDLQNKVEEMEESESTETSDGESIINGNKSTTESEDTSSLGNISTKVADLQTGDPYISEENRNVRSQKDATSNILGMLKSGDMVLVKESIDENGWLTINYKGQNGYLYFKEEDKSSN